MAVTPQFAATPRIGCGHITAARPDLGVNVAAAPATGSITVTFSGPATGTFTTADRLPVLAGGVATGVELQPTGTVTLAADSAKTFTVQTVVLSAQANGWAEPGHTVGLPETNTYNATAVALNGSLTGGVDAAWGTRRDPTGAVVVLTGAATGTKVAEVSVQATGPTSEGGTVVLWLHDGTNPHAWCEFAVPVVTDAGTYARVGAAVGNLLLPDETWSLRATASHMPDAGELVVTALGGDL